jgi:hypothetical protein
LIPGLWRPSSETRGQTVVWLEIGRRKVPEGEESPTPMPADPISSHSVIIPEKLDSFINKFAEYTHEKWAFDKVNTAALHLYLPCFPQASYLPRGLRLS